MKHEPGIKEAVLRSRVVELENEVDHLVAIVIQLKTRVEWLLEAVLSKSSSEEIDSLERSAVSTDLRIMNFGGTVGERIRQNLVKEGFLPPDHLGDVSP